MKAGFYTKMASDGMRKNGRLYAPFLVTCILMASIFYIIHFLGYSGVMNGMAGSGTATDLMKMGSVILIFFITIFLQSCSDDCMPYLI